MPAAGSKLLSKPTGRGKIDMLEEMGQIGQVGIKKECEIGIKCIVTTHPFSCVGQQAAREPGVMAKKGHGNELA